MRDGRSSSCSTRTRTESLLARLALPPRLAEGVEKIPLEQIAAERVPPPRPGRRTARQAPRRRGHPPAPDRAQARPVRRRALRARREGRPPLPRRRSRAPDPARRAPGRGRRRGAPAGEHRRRRAHGGRVRRRSHRRAAARPPRTRGRAPACCLEAAPEERPPARSAELVRARTLAQLTGFSSAGFNGAAGRSGCTASAPSSRPDTSPSPRRSTPSRR